MAYDLLITHGTVVDGNGGPRFKADVAVQGSRVVALGEINGSAATVIDAAGKIVCPGFVDPHTHYDAQITCSASVRQRTDRVMNCDQICTGT